MTTKVEKITNENTTDNACYVAILLKEADKHRGWLLDPQPLIQRYTVLHLN